MLNQNDPAPSFELKNGERKTISLSDYIGKKIVIYFYPKDETPGCTIEAIDFSKLNEEFAKQNAIVFGISKDSCESHALFSKKQNLSVILLSDPESEVQKKYGVWKPIKFMGREFLGTKRTTFLINENGKIIKIWDSVNPVGHAKAVLEEVKKL